MMAERGELASLARQIAAKAEADGFPPALSLRRLRSVISNKRNLQEMQDVRGAQKSTRTSRNVTQIGGSGIVENAKIARE